MNYHHSSQQNFFPSQNANNNFSSLYPSNYNNFVSSSIIDNTSYLEKYNKFRSHMINLYQINREFIKIEVSNSDENSKNRNEPYGNFSGYLFSKLTFVELFTDKNLESGKLIKLSDENGKHYVVKRFILTIDNQIQIDDIFKYPDLDNFIGGHFLEFCLFKLFASSPHSAKVIDFKVIKITKINSLATELLMEYAGIELGQIKNKTPQMIFTWVEQMINALNYLECYRIEHNDIKIENFLIYDYDEKKQKNGIIKLIDFDIGANLSITRNKASGIYSYSSVSISPEKYQIISPYHDNPAKIDSESLIISENISKINTWRSQIYSLGIVILCTLDFFTAQTIVTRSNIDEKYKSSIEQHNLLIKEVEKFMSLKITFQKTQKDKNLMLFLKELVIKVCLRFNNEERLDANEIKMLIEIFNENKFPTFDYDTVIKDIKESRLKTKEDFEIELQKRNEIINFLVEEKKAIFERIGKQNRIQIEKDSSLKSVLEAYIQKTEDTIKTLELQLEKQREKIKELNDLSSNYPCKYRENFQVKLKFPSYEGIYKGEITNELPNGMGQITFSDKVSYIGLFKDGVIEGFGKMTDSKGNFYFGSFSKGEFSNLGLIVTYNSEVKNKQMYMGTWEKGKKNGKGIFYYNDKGQTYYGDWKDDKREGIGFLTTEQHFAYIELFKADKSIKTFEKYKLSEKK